MCTYFYNLCNWVCERYSDIEATEFYGCECIKVYVENARRPIGWENIPDFIQSFEVHSLSFKTF